MYNRISFVSALPGVWFGRENRKPGEIPGRYRRCQRVMPHSSAKAGHWGNLRRQSAAGERPQARESQKTCSRETVPEPPEPGRNRYNRIGTRKKAAAACHGLPGLCFFVSVRLAGRAEHAGKGRYIGMRRTRDRLLSFLLALVMVASLLPGRAWAAGTLEIRSAENFANMSADGDYILMDDITIEVPYGSSTQRFTGTFDGNGHTVTLELENGGHYFGAFAYIGAGGKVQNLTTDGSVTGKNYVGGIAGYCIGEIVNCGNTALISGTGYVGGVAGQAGDSANKNAKITNCYNLGSVQATSKRAGGVVGSAQFVAVSNCYNNETVSASGNVGGILGYNTSSIISNCYWREGASGQGVGGTDGNGPGFSSYTDTTVLLANLNAGVGGNRPWKMNDDLLPVLDLLTLDGVDTTPALSIPQSAGPLYVQPGMGGNELTLTVKKSNMSDDTEVSWSRDNARAVELEEISNTTDSIKVKAVTGGTAVVTAKVMVDGKDYTATSTITVMPNITTVQIDGILAVGQTVQAHVNVAGNSEYDYENDPKLNFQWRKATYDQYVAGTYQDISGATSRTFTITEDLLGCYLSVSFRYGNENRSPNRTYGPIGPAASSVLTADYNALTVDASDIKEDKTLTLPVSGAAGSSIQWASSHEDVIDPRTGAVTLPETGIATVTLTATLSFSGENKTRTFTMKVYSRQAVEEEANNKQLQLENAVAALGSWYKLYPICGTDANVNDMLKADLAEKGYAGIDVAVQSVTQVYGGAGIGRSGAENGAITYFYADPNTTPIIRFGSFRVTFLLSKDGAALEYRDVPVILYWDVNRVKEVMTAEILDRVDEAAIWGGNGSLTQVSSNLTLPKVVDGKKWAVISWASSDENVISVSSENQTTADTLFDPYVGVVKPGVTAREVVLTATFNFQFTNDITGTERPISLSKVFRVTVAPMTGGDADAIRAALLEKLNTGFEKAGLTDAVTGARLTPAGDGSYTASNDIQLPTTRDFGVDGKYYPITLTSSDPEVIVAPDVRNAARVWVYRPPVGAPDGEATVTVTMADRDTSLTQSKEFKIRVPALTQEEIDAELALIGRVKAAYFDGIKGKNTAPDSITGNLSPFQEVYEDGSGALVWVRDRKDLVNHGIVPVAMENWQALEAWRLFRSSNPAVVSHENLLVTRQGNTKAVTITSALSSETMGRYGELYQSDPALYAGYAALAPLYNQPVSANLVVRGMLATASAAPVVERINVSFTLRGSDSAWIGTTKLMNLDETTTVYDVFQKVLKDNGYRYTAKGFYVSAITTPDNVTLGEGNKGANSGWMYRVNGVIPDVGMGGYGLKDGDSIQVFFTKDYTKESGYANTDWGGGGVQTAPKAGVTENKDGTYAVTLPTNSKGPVLAILPNVKGGQVAMIMHKDGTQEVVRKSVLRDGDMYLLLEADATIRLVDYVSTFQDVNSEAWYASAVDFVSGRGLFSGVSGNSFAPEATLNRGALVTVLYALEQPGAQTVEERFSDVGAGDWYAQGTAWAVETGVISGYGNGRFGPQDPVTREQLALMLYQYANSLSADAGGRSSLAGFKDGGNVSSWAAEAVSWAVDAGILSGRTGGILDPSGPATRAEAAVMLCQFMSFLLE